MHDDQDREIVWQEIGRAVGFVLTIAGLFSLALMVLAVISIIWFGESSPAR